MGVGSLQPMEEPTTRLGSSSSGGLWGHQLDGGTLQVSRRVWIWARRAWLACLWVLILLQLSKQQPLKCQARQMGWSPIMGIVGVPSLTSVGLEELGNA